MKSFAVGCCFRRCERMLVLCRCCTVSIGMRWVHSVVLHGIACQTILAAAYEFDCWAHRCTYGTSSPRYLRFAYDCIGKVRALLYIPCPAALSGKITAILLGARGSRIHESQMPVKRHRPIKYVTDYVCAFPYEL